MKYRFVKVEKIGEKPYWCTQRFYWLLGWLYEGGLFMDEKQAREAFLIIRAAKQSGTRTVIEIEE
jgi:hypothetical protein